MSNLDPSPPPSSAADRRNGPRARALLAAKIMIADGRMSSDCLVRDLSVDGARVKISRTVPLPQAVSLLLIREGVLFDAALAWRRDDEAGFAFSGRHDVRSGGDPALAFAHRIWAEHAPR